MLISGIAFVAFVLVTPFVAFSAFRRVRRLERWADDFAQMETALTERVERQQARSDRLEQEIAALRSRIGPRPEEAVAPPPRPQETPVTLEETTPAPAPVPVEAEDTAEPAAPEEPARVAASKIETPADAVAVTDAIPETPQAETPPVAPKPEPPEEPVPEAPKEPAPEPLVPDIAAFEKGAEIAKAPAGAWTRATPHPTPKPRKTEKPEPPRPSRHRAAFSALLQRLGGGDTDWETRIGQNWLNIIGIVILIVGLVLLIQQSLILLAPLGKIMIGVGVALALMAAGAYLQRRARYRVFAFTLVGGGWGLLYFTAYAAHNIEAARIIDNAYLGTAVLLAVAAGILGQSFHYRRQAVTALAYGLAFLALHLSPLSFYSLLATAMLAGTIPFVLRRTDWRQLGVIIAVASYATHARWLWATELAADDPARVLILGGLEASQVFWGNIAVLAVYWVIFCAAAIAHKPGGAKARSLDVATSLVNTAGFIGLLGWQVETYLPGNLHYIAPPAILAYAATALVDARMARPVLSRLNGTIAVVLFAIAMPVAIDAEGLNWGWLPPYWALGGLVLWQIDCRFELPLYRVQGYALTALAAAAALVTSLAPVRPFDGWLLVVLGLSPILPAALMRECIDRAPERYAGGADRLVRLASVAVMPLLAGLALWKALPEHVAGLGMLAVAYALLEAGIRTRRSYLRIEGYLLGAAGLLTLLNRDLVLPPPEAAEAVRAVLAAGAGLAYLAGLRMRHAGGLTVKETALAWIAPVFATVFVYGAVYQWLPPDEVPVVWGFWAILLLEAGHRLHWTEFRVLSYAAMGVAAALLCQLILQPGVSSNADQGIAQPWLLAGAVIAYLSGAKMRHASGFGKYERDFSWVGPGFATFFAAVAMLRWLPLEQVAIAWALWALVLLEAGQRLRWAELRWQAVALLAVAAGLCGMTQASILPDALAVAPWTHTAIVSLLMHVAAWRIAFPSVELQQAEQRTSSLALFFGAVLFAAAAWTALPAGLVAAACIGWALIFDEAGRRLQKPDVRAIAWAMAGAAFVLAMGVNVYRLVPMPPPPDQLARIGMAAVVAGLYALHPRVRGWAGPVKLPRLVTEGAFLNLGTILFAFALWRELPSVAVAVAWAALAFALIEISERAAKPVLARQAQVLIFAAAIRLFFANFLVPGEAFGLSHRLLTVGAVTLLVYYMRALMAGGWGRGLRLLPAPVFSWGGAGLIVVLARFEVGREYAVAVWSALILVLAVLGTRWPDRDFRYQAYAICLLVFGRAWSTNAYLEGSLWGMSERVVTTLPSQAALLVVVFLIPRSFDAAPFGAPETRLGRVFAFADRHARAVVSLLFAAQLTLLVFYEMTIDLVSIGWAVSALVLMLIGFVLNERSLRLYGLALLMVCLLKVVFIDLDGVETIYRVFSFIVLGLVLLLVSLGYSRFRDVLGRYL
ncbi:DUF2339 domain-containing protein [Aestuariicoccus sp. MJ-SS9]|uniref:DUF2339 domain-containing protein n=1 Tax=Aestuariicoccus sp. MJ-SS9 TaxID=3079855 RepID=UPI002906E42D|nr:DUF2339 domain-containing protein [Aestuariicoccus sp. MJ-SS9]MDU8913170.1 DUF2339 domain-containing protein [Aestuariicoccus sp. MJ-SS9]